MAQTRRPTLKLDTSGNAISAKVVIYGVLADEKFHVMVHLPNKSLSIQ